MSIEDKYPDADKHDIDIPGQVNIDLENGEIRQVSRPDNLNSSVVIFMFRLGRDFHPFLVQGSLFVKYLFSK